MKPLGWLVAPIALLLLVKIAPLASGERTLYLRDVLNTHLPMKHVQAEALRAGYLPLVDVYRAGGQPALGNPNSVPLYPDNVLYLLAPTLWALNAHFWLHWLAALVAVAWLARAHGLSRPAAFAAGTFYAFGGYLFSLLSFYNLVAGAALAPALIAAALRLAQSGQRRFGVAFGGLFALLWLGGEPVIALLAFVVATATFFAAAPTRAALGALVAAALSGTLLALPQLVETLRILPFSFRGHAGVGSEALSVGSLDPRQLAEWFLPFFFGAPDRLGPGRFWGSAFYGGYPPLLVTLYPGLCVLALAVIAAPAWRSSRAVQWSLAAVCLGFLLALGEHHPLTGWLLSRSDVLRYPVKFILPAVLGGAMLAAIGFERALVTFDANARGSLRSILGVLALFYTAGFAVLWFGLGELPERLRGTMPAALADSFVEGERLRWAGLCLLSVLVLAAAALATRLAAAHGRLGGSLLLTVHAASQLLLLSPALATDETAAYARPPTVLAAIPPAARTVHGSKALFGPLSIKNGVFPDYNAAWLQRRAFAELYPAVGPLFGRRFELNTAADELDAFLTRMAGAAVEKNRDSQRLRLLKAWGVSRLLLDRELGPRHATAVRLLLREEHFGRPLFVYEIVDSAPEVSVAATVLRAPDLLVAFAQLTRADFDARTTAVIQGDGPAKAGSGGKILSLVTAAESLETTVVAVADSVVVWQRSHLPIYRATVDGRAAPILFANFHRMGVAVPAGEHVVRIWADRRPLRWSLAAAAVGALGLLALGSGWPRRGQRGRVGSVP
jgi:hypothetical protein